jgi:hypothetical protein
MVTHLPDDWLDALTHLEQTQVAYDTPPPADDPGIRLLTGRVPVLVSAPHATRHWRESAWKREDEYTAALAHWLHDHSGAHALYPTHRINPDPHDDDDTGPYKQRLREHIAAHDIRLVLDLHGARGDRDFGLALGTIYGQTCRPYEGAIVTALTGQGFHTDGAGSSLDRVALNLPRYAGGAVRPTVTRFVWERFEIPAVQIEINAWARIVTRLPDAWGARHRIAPDFRGDPARIRRVLDGLRRIIALVADE